jgi:paraquat-inducible protein A
MVLHSRPSHQAWQICQHCGELLRRVEATDDQILLCSNCQMPLPLGKTAWVQPATALSVAAVVLFIICNSFDFLSLKLVSFEQSASILSGVAALLAHDQWLLAALVFSTIFLFPLLEISALLYLLVPFQLNKKLPGQIAVLRWLIRAQPWSMLEIFLLAILVTSVKLGDMASLVPGISMYAFFSLVPILTITYAVIDRQSLWSFLVSDNCFVAKPDDKLYTCNVCEAMVGETLLDHSSQCPRCYSPMYKRIPNSLQKTTALMIAAVILYIPANLLPFMTTRTLTGDREDTLVSGVLSLMKHDMWLIAAVVFIASIVVPMAKLGVLIYLLASAHYHRYRNQAAKIRLYYVTELIGRWSMVDVYVVTLLTALVQFGFLGNVQPGNALVAFAAVVVLTMLAAETFDPRLLDAPQEQPGDFPANAFKHESI